MDSPLLSVRLITYNHEKYIRQAIESVLAQKVSFKWNIIIADDFSTDSTRTILLEYEKKYPDLIELILQPKNVGPSKNFSDLMNFQNSTYIAYLEGDDYWLDPLKLQKQVDFLETNPEFSIAFCNVLVKCESSGKCDFVAYQDSKIENSCIPTIPVPPEETDIAFLAIGNYIHSPGVVFRNLFFKSGLPKYMETVPVGDWPLYMYLARSGKIKYFSEVMCAYRVHKSSMFSQQSYLKILYGELMIYPALFSEGIFDEKILKIWEHKMEEMLLVFCKNKDDTTGTMMDTVLESYSKYFPAIMNRVSLRLTSENQIEKKQEELLDKGRIYRFFKKIGLSKKI